MNKWTWLIVGIAVLWALISLNWYVCGIKDLCTINEATNQTTSEEADRRDVDTERVDLRGDDTVRGGEVRSGTRTATTTRQVSERVTITCQAYLTGSVTFGANNASEDVLKVEQFLNEFQGESLQEDGIYGQEDVMAVERFQEKYSSVILDPLGLNEPTGRVLGSTRDHINRLHCALTARN